MRKLLALAVTLVSCVAGTAHANVRYAMTVTATFSGWVDFADRCENGDVCGSADTWPSGTCYGVTAVADRTVSVNGCRGQIPDFHYDENGDCVGLDSADFVYTDLVTGQTFPKIPISIFADGETITFSGRYVSVGEAGAYSVAGTMWPACGDGGSWTGTLTYTS